MTGLKSGSGDDLWDDAGDDSEAEESADTEANSTDEVESTSETETAQPANTPDHSYIVRRAIQDKSVQFERDERLTFFVHDDVVEGERDLLTEVESALGRDVPKFDVREAVYRAALQNPDDVLEELLAMGYSLDESS